MPSPTTATKASQKIAIFHGLNKGRPPRTCLGDIVTDIWSFVCHTRRVVVHLVTRPTVASDQYTADSTIVDDSRKVSSSFGSIAQASPTLAYCRGNRPFEVGLHFSHKSVYRAVRTEVECRKSSSGVLS